RLEAGGGGAEGSREAEAVITVLPMSLAGFVVRERVAVIGFLVAEIAAPAGERRLVVVVAVDDRSDHAALQRLPQRGDLALQLLRKSDVHHGVGIGMVKLP